MNTPTDRPDPLDPHELELARILRALPGGEPPAALDARILRSAQDALSTPAPRRRALWAAGGTGGALWGIGSAAAAILAVGIGWRLSVPPDSNLPVPRSLPTAVDGAEDDSTPVEFVPMPQRLPDSSGPPAPPMAELEVPQPRPVATPPPPPPVAAAAPAAPEPFPETLAEEQSSELDSIVVTGGRAQPATADAAAPAAAAPDAGLVGRDARSAYSERRRDEALGQLSADAAAKASAPAEAAATGLAREAVADEDLAAKRAQDDSALAAEAWLARIRARRDAGDVFGARASLRLFATMHPDRAVPADLRPLLEE